MTLTEQWKKRELPAGFCYLKVSDELVNYPVISQCVIDLGYAYSYFYNEDESSITEVLAKVPTYQEYQSLLDEHTILLLRVKIQQGARIPTYLLFMIKKNISKTATPSLKSYYKSNQS